MDDCETSVPKISFKSSKKRQVRQRKESSESEEETATEFNKEEYDKTRELQKLRKRTAGTNVVALVSGKKISKLEEVVLNDDPFKTKTGGLVNMKDMKEYKQTEDAYEVGTQFSKETHIRDEDDELRKFIDTEMGRRKGDHEDEEERGPEYLSPEDAALLSLPEHLRKSTFKKDQQMLSAQMLSGIPEVDLGIEAKIQNIERTEQAKRKLLAEAKRGNTTDDRSKSQQFMQHDRFKIEVSTTIGREKERKKEPECTEEKPNTVNIYAEEENDRKLLQGKARDEQALHKFKQRN